MPSRERLLTIRSAVPADAETLAQIDAESWPKPLAADAEQWRARIEVFPEGQLII